MLIVFYGDICVNIYLMKLIKSYFIFFFKCRKESINSRPIIQEKSSSGCSSIKYTRFKASNGMLEKFISQIKFLEFKKNT